MQIQEDAGQSRGMDLLRPFRSRLGTTAGKPPATTSRFINDLDTPLLRVNSEGDALRVRDFFEGIFAFGATGSGKSSGVGIALLMAMMGVGWGGLILCAKPCEAERCIRAAQQCGRGDDVIIMRPGSGRHFNFIEHEMRRADGLGADVFNLVSLMMVMVEAMRVALNQAQEEGGFWISAMRELLANAIEPLIAATGRFRLDELMQFITTAPNRPEDMHDPEWCARSYWYWAMDQAHDAPRGPPMSEASRRAVQDYWLGNFIRLDPKTRSNVVATLTATISPFLRGHLHEMFCTDTTVVPELTHEGAIIIVDCPIKTMGINGVMAALVMKYCWQRSIEARLVGPHTRPGFLYVDESQLFKLAYDLEFQGTARSALAATVYLTQNLSNYYATQPGRDPKAATDALLGNFQTKIFHTNTDVATNQYAADLIGKGIVRRASGNWSENGGWSRGENDGTTYSYQRGKNKGRQSGSQSGGGVTYSDTGSASYSINSGGSHGRQEGESSSWSRGQTTGTSRGESGGWNSGGGWSEQMDYLVPPSFFASGLRKGGPENDFLVDGVLVQGGRRFRASGGHSLFVTFQQ